MRPVNQQSLTEIAAQLSELTMRVAELSAQLGFAEVVQRNSINDQEPEPIIIEEDQPGNRIELLTENGFLIVRPWEINGSAPKNGECRFLVTDPYFTERAIDVWVATPLLIEISVKTQGRIEPTSSFWICCAERHLANYLWEQDAFPRDGKLIVESLDPDEVILMTRWGKSDS